MKFTLWRACALALVLTPGPPRAAVSVSTDIASYTEGDATGYRPQKIVLLVNDAPGETRKAIERGLVEALGRRGVVAVTPAQISVPPGEATVAARREAYRQAFRREGIDSSLSVNLDVSKDQPDAEGEARAVLIQMDANRAVWRALIKVTPAGRSKQSTTALVNGIVNALIADDHLARS